ncbi:MAG: ferritin-like domain-containing protein [Acidimicrobiales bacterium]
MQTPQLPADDEINASIKIIHDQAERIFLWDYRRDRSQLVTLYNKAMGSQWNSVTDLDWSIEVDPETVIAKPGPVREIVREAVKLPGSPIGAWGERELTAFGVESLKAQLSQFMHGEQGAMMTAAKIVETVPWIDAKYYASTQTMDEARHTEVFAKYLDTKLGEAYQMSPFLEDQITGLLEDGRWDIAYLGMQIIIESLALGAFGDLLRRTDEPLLRKLLRYVMSDEARHVAFGVLSLGEYYQGLTSSELFERQEFLYENSLLNRARSTTPEIWERMGTSIEAVGPYLLEAAAKSKASPYAGFAKSFFAKLVPNVRKLGLLDANDAWLRNRWADAGLLQFEFADDTASDYTAYDAVAADRNATSAS